MPRTNIVEKAARLIIEDRAKTLPVKAVVQVQGDTGSYSVIVYESGKAWCPCAAQTACSHRLAAQWIVLAEQGPGNETGPSAQDPATARLTAMTA